MQEGQPYDFMKKNKVAKVRRLKGDEKTDEIVITIPLKSGKAKDQPLDVNFVKVLEYEYAVKYLEALKIEPTPKMIAKIL